MSRRTRRTLAAAGGDGGVAGPEDDQLAARIESEAVDRFLYLGDVYETGTAAEYANHYHPSYGRFKAKSRPTMGNHEWANRAVGYDSYWGALAPQQPGDGHYYSFDFGGWHFISLNTEEPDGAGSAQLNWLRSDLAANAGETRPVGAERGRDGRDGRGPREPPGPTPRTSWPSLANLRGPDCVVEGLSISEQGDPMNRIRSIALTAAAAALLAAPAVSQAHHRPSHPGGSGNSGENRGGKCVVKKGFVVKGTLVSFTADDPATPADEESVTLTITKVNKHASRSGLTDADPATDGTQYTVSGDPFKAKLSGFEAGETPGAGDKVRVSGKVAVTKRRCEPNASVEDRYDDVNVRRVKIVDVD